MSRAARSSRSSDRSRRNDVGRVARRASRSRTSEACSGRPRILREVHGRVRVMTDAEQQDFRVQLMRTPDRAVGPVRHVDGMRRGDLCRMRADARRMRAGCRCGSRLACARTCRRRFPSRCTACAAHRRLFVIVAHAGHDERAARAGRHAQRRDQIRGRAGASAELEKAVWTTSTPSPLTPRADELFGDAIPRESCASQTLLII